MIRWLPVAVLPLLSLLPSGSSIAVQQPAFSSRTLGVRVDVLVADGRNPVAGLTAADFELRDNGVAQAIGLIEASDAPVDLLLVLDTSASTRGKTHSELTAATRTLLDGLKPSDRVALTTFGHAVTPRIALTSDVSTVRAVLDRIRPQGETAVLDGVYVALAATLANTGRSLVVVYTDGTDTRSWLQPEEVLDSAKRSSAVIYAVTADARHWAALEGLTDATGGQMIRVAPGGDLREVFDRILREFRSRYVLTYTPRGVPPGGFHRLEVRAKRRGLTVKARTSYMGVGPEK